MEFPFAQPLYVMAKAAGPECNLACRYCYYLEKKALYPRQPQDSRHTRMSLETLETFTRQYIQAQTTPEIVFTWHGGEPTLRPLDFYRRAMDLQRRYAGPDRRILNCLQTNGTLLDDQWCRFLRHERWLVGLSVDGPAILHDPYRRSPDGRPTHMRVLRAIQLLNRHGVEWNAMAVVNDLTGDHPDEFYRFFRDIDCRYVQFTPVVERYPRDGRVTPWSVNPEQWGRFLCRLFDLWVRQAVGHTFFQLFDATLANWVGVTPGVCTMAETCGHAGALEHNGDLYACDHFVYPPYLRGNIHTSTLVEMMDSPEQRAFGAAKRDDLPASCRQCQWLKACHGECPRNRFATDPLDGTSRLNYLCQGYRHFFSHVAPYMDRMAQLLQDGLPPAQIMSELPL